MRCFMMRTAVALLLAGAITAGCEQRGSAPSAGREQTEPPPVDVKAAAEALGPPASPAVKAQYDAEFEAVGSEPFWRLDLLKDWASFVRPGLPEVGALPGLKDVRAQGALVVAGPLVITLRAGECVHVSGETFPYNAKVEFEGVAYEGCARKATGETASPTQWTTAIETLLPAIDACLARVEHGPGRVTIAYLFEAGEASVRLLDADGGRFECNVPTTGGAISYWGAIGDRDMLEGEREPLFTRAPTPPPQDECLANEEAKGADGATIGWFSRRKPC